MASDFLLSLAQAVTKGLLTGMVYGLMALGLSVIFGVMRVVNFAHGEMMVVGMYLAWAGLDVLQIPPALSLPLIAILFFGLGYGLQRGLIQPFINRPEHQQFLLLLAIATLLANGCLALAGPDSRAVQLEFAVRLLRAWASRIRCRARARGCRRARHCGPAVAVLHPDEDRHRDSRGGGQPHGGACRRA